MEQSQKERLLRRAAQFDSDSGSESNSSSSAERTTARHKQKHSSKKRKHKKEPKSRKTHKKHKRSDHEKIAELEKRAAAMGTASMLSGSRLGFGRHSSTPAAATGDAVTLDTRGDANNALYESLYGGDVPRYTRMDPLDLVRVSRRIGGQLAFDGSTGNATADRYYRGRHYLQERNRSAKRVNLAQLQHRHNSRQRGSASTLMLPTTTPLLPPSKAHAAGAGAGAGGAGAGAGAGPLQDSAGGSIRRLAIPTPAFIPLEAPEELLQQSQQQQQEGSWRQRPGHFGMGSNQQQVIVPTELVEQVGLTPDELLLEATRAWNVAVRERPQDEELWLEFAAFQHSAAQQQQPRGRTATTGLLDPVTAEKQISLLSRGLTHHPSSTQLLLALLRCYAAVAPDADAAEAKWAAVLARQGGSWELWREYVALRQSSFADFKVSGVQKVYQDALYSLQLELLAHRRRVATMHKQQQQHMQPPQLTPQQLQQLTPLAAAAAAAAAAGSSGATGLAAAVTLGEEALELQLVQLLLGLLCAEFEAGYCEHALAKIQALLEFHLFPPTLPPGGVPALLRLFAAYWSAGVPCIGEEGARGWAYWCCWHAMGMEQPASAAAQAEAVTEAEVQQDPAGWSGWFEVQPQQQETAPAAEGSPGGQGKAARAAAAADEQGQKGQNEEHSEGSADQDDDANQQDDDQLPAEDAEEEVDEEELMRQLGLQLEQQLQEVERQGLPADVLARWVSEEASCCATQWQPLRPDGTAPGSTPSSTATGPEPADDDSSPPDPVRIARLDCVELCLFLLRSNAALRRLVLGCLELVGLRLGAGGSPWCSSTCPTPFQQLHAVSSSPAAAAVGASSSSSRGGVWSDAAADASTAGEAAAGAGAVGRNQPPEQQWQQRRQAPWYAASDARWQCAVNLLQRLVAGGPCSDWPELCQALMLLQASKPSEAAAATAAAAAAGAPAGSAGDAAAGESLGLHVQLQQLTLDGAAATASACDGGSSSSVWPSRQQLSAARAAAKQLLSDQQDNLLLYDAYGCLEAAAGQAKTGRKVFETALALATAAAAGVGAGAGSNGRAAAAGAAAGGQDEASAAAAAAAAAPLLAVHLAQLELTAGGKAGLSKAHVALHAVLAQQQLQAAAALEAAAAGTAAGDHQQQAGSGLLADSQLRAARVRFQQRIPELMASAGGALTPTAASTIAAAALFELVVGLRRGAAAAGLDAAVAVCRQVTAAVPEAVRATSAQHEHLTILQCHMLVAAATGARALVPGFGSPSAGSGKGSSGSGVDAAALVAAVPPARAREALSAALNMYPHSPDLLQLQIALDHACYTLSNLRRQLALLLESASSPGLWAVALQAEASRPGGRVRLGVLFERALSSPSVLQWHQQERLQRQRKKQAWQAACAGLPQPRGQQQGPSQAEQRQQLLQQQVTAEGSAAALLDLALWDGYRGWGHCAGLWQQYIQYELGLGRLDAARKLFLRAVHAVPGAKGLWLSGFGGVCAGLQPRECSGLLSVMQEREVVVRTDVYEVLLAAMAENPDIMRV